MLLSQVAMLPGVVARLYELLYWLLTRFTGC
jgi:hypothetical protein